MKKILMTSFAVSALFTLFSCAELDAPTVSEGGENIEYKAMTINLVQTKTYLNKGQHSWSGGDDIFVFDQNGDRYVFEGEKVAAEDFVFTCASWPVESVPTYAIFAPNGNPSIDVETDKITVVHISDQRIYNAASFGKQANTSVAKIELGQDGKYYAEFKNICGLIKFTLTTEYVMNVRIESLDKTPIAGRIKVDYNNGEPVYEMLEDKDYYISVTPRKDGEEYTPSSYYVCLLPCELSSLKVTITNINGRSESFTGSSLMKVERNGVIDLGTLDVRTVKMKFSGENLYGLPESNTTGEGTFTVKDDLGMSRDFGIGFNYKFLYDANSDFCLKFLRNSTDTSNQIKYGYIKLPVYESMYLNKATVSLLNTSSKYLNLYASVSADGLTAPENPIATRKNPVKGTPKTWNFSEGTPAEGHVLDKSLPAVQYYMVVEAVPTYMDEVNLTYTFTSLGPDTAAE